MWIVFSLAWAVLIAILAIAFLYVSGSYLLVFYDRRLGQVAHVAPPHEQLTSSASTAERWKGYVYEVLSTMLCILIYPFSRLMRRRTGGRGHHPVVMVHGFQHNRSAWLIFRMRLRRAGFGPLYALQVHPRFGPIEEMARHLAKEIESLGHEEISLVGHSMGGLVCTYYAEHLAPSQRVRRVITLGSPLSGTRLSCFVGSRAAQQMRTGSPFITSLEKELRINSVTPTFHLAAQHDNLIVPPQSALLRRYPDRERVLPWQGHLTLLFSPTVARTVIEWLSPRARTPQVSAHLAYSS